MIRILYVSGTYMPAAGGAEISVFTLLKYVATKAHVTVLTRGSAPVSPTFSSNVNIRAIACADKAAAQVTLERILREETFDIVLTQNAWSDIALNASSLLSIPSIVFMRSPAGNLDFSRSSAARPSLILSNSSAVASFVLKQWHRVSPVLRSPVDFRDYVISDRRPACITMVNPIEIKGGEVVRALAEAMPDRKFLIVKGWGHLRRGSTWDTNLLNDLSDGLGDPHGWDPRESDFSQLSNVTVSEPLADMRRVYECTRLLLVPSIKSESCPRVAIEAMSAGIPVVGSNNGGIPEALADSGIIVDEFTRPEAWVTAIESLDNATLYNELSARAVIRARSHDPATIVDTFMLLLECVCAGGDELDCLSRGPFATVGAPLTTPS